MSKTDEHFMAIALETSQLGRGQVEPNPIVGAVLVRNDVELARGWHKNFGGLHAEIEALSAAQQEGIDPSGATMYVTLEPCCHQGKTPPCTDALIAAKVARVVVALEDPDKQVSGAGIAKLRIAGIDVTTGLCESEARKLLAPYIKLRTKGRPWVICKWAQTPEGYIALAPGAGRWISGELSRAYVHELRSLCDGILVGIETVLADDPILTNRSGQGSQPARVMLDSNLRMPITSKLVKTASQSPLLIATTASAITAKPTAAEQLRSHGVELLGLPVDANGIDLEALLDELGKRNWTNLLVEGGATVLGSFVYSHLADELLAFVAPKAVTADKATIEGDLPRFDIAMVRKTLSLGRAQKRLIGEDKLVRYVLSD